MAAHLNHIGLVVADMARALAFYRALGMDIAPDDDASPHVEVDLGGGFRLAFDTFATMQSFDPNWKPAPGGVPGSSLAFECDSPAEVDGLYAELTGLGHHGHLAPFDAFWGQRYATIHDPDGHAVDLYAALPVSG